MKKTIHIHQAKLRRGEPAIIVRTYKGVSHHRRVEVLGPCVIVNAASPDRCGARCWIETESEVAAS